MEQITIDQVRWIVLTLAAAEVLPCDSMGELEAIAQQTFDCQWSEDTTCAN